MDSPLARRLPFTKRRLGLAFSGLIGLYGLVMSFLVATSIGLNTYSTEELESIERLQGIFRNIVAIGAIVGTAAALVATFHTPSAIALFAVAGVITATGLGLAGGGWAVVSGPRVEYYLAPVPVVYWATAGLLTRSFFSKTPTTHSEVSR